MSVVTDLARPRLNCRLLGRKPVQLLFGPHARFKIDDLFIVVYCGVPGTAENISLSYNYNLCFKAHQTSDRSPIIVYINSVRVI